MNQRDCQKAPQGRGTSGERGGFGGGWELKGRCEGDRSVGNRANAFRLQRLLSLLEAFTPVLTPNTVIMCGSNPGTSLKRMDNGRARQ